MKINKMKRVQPTNSNISSSKHALSRKLSTEHSQQNIESELRQMQILPVSKKLQIGQEESNEFDMLTN